jgi:glycosyltransferase involved in cell wall biosynthesis
VRHKRSFAIALGRICPEKGFHIAIYAAKRADIPLLLAGDIFAYETHQRYFREEIVPRLDGQRRFIGPIGLRRKRRLLAAARCLLIPSLVSETSSLVAMESLACGTPVIAFPAGALPEIIEHGRTGFLVRDAHEMAAAIRLANTLDAKACRQVAESRFSAERMCRQYSEAYQRIAAGRKGDMEMLEIEETRTNLI